MSNKILEFEKDEHREIWRAFPCNNTSLYYISRSGDMYEAEHSPHRGGSQRLGVQIPFEEATRACQEHYERKYLSAPIGGETAQQGVKAHRELEFTEDSEAVNAPKGAWIAQPYECTIDGFTRIYTIVKHAHNRYRAMVAGDATPPIIGEGETLISAEQICRDDFAMFENYRDQRRRERKGLPAAEQGVKADDLKLRFDLLPPEALEEITAVLTFGATKYGERNWEKGISYGRIFAASMRHLWAWWRGEAKDPETGLSHLAHAGCCILFLLTYESRGMVKFDDRGGK